MYLDRPKIKLTLAPIDEWLESLCFIGCVWLWIYCIKAYRILPETIPTHFNLKGVADDYGSKATMFILPSVATAIYILITVLNQYPHIFNYMVKITADNAEKQYSFATRMLRVVKLIVIVLIGVICIMITKATSNASLTRLLDASLPALLAILAMNTIIFIERIRKTKRTA